MSSTDISWGASFGSQILAELSILEAKAKQSEEEEEEKCEASIDDVFIKSNASGLPEQVIQVDSPLLRSRVNSQKSNKDSVSVQDEVNDAIPSASVSLCGFMCSDPSEKKSETPNVISSIAKVLSPSVPSPLSCSTPVNLRRASLRSGSSLRKLQLDNWGLPSSVVRRYAEKKITSLFPWQVECLETGRVLKRGNLIYSAPTSAGKTLVAELLMLKTVFEQSKKGIYILPFVAVAKEKTRVLRSITEDVGVRVESFAGSSAPPGGLKNCDLAICTIEKANSLVNRLIEEGTLSQIGIIVVDELHLIGDPHRGYLLELLLTKVLYASSRAGQPCPIQVVGMSATLPDLEVLAKWLRADLYKTDFRPIPLKEHIKIGSDVFSPTDFRLIRKLDPTLAIPNDIDHVIYLSLETVLIGCSILIFCPTKNWCEKMAQHVSGEFFNLGSNSNSPHCVQLRQQLKGDQLALVLEKLKATPAGLDSVLGQTVRFGVAFHHAGLTTEERDIIEGAFRIGVLRVLVATSTLSSGVNLPARRVIIRTPIFHGTVLDHLVYRQMIGRAGRYGEDSVGESYLLCQPAEKNQVQRMFAAVAHPLKSCLLLDQTPAMQADPSLAISSSMKRAMLEIIATGSASTVEDLKLYGSCTLLAVLNDVPDEILQTCVTWLVSNDFVRRVAVDGAIVGERLAPTQLGLACLASSLSPDESLILLNELRTARKGIILDSDLHLVYQITPTYVANQMTQIDWLHYLTLWEDLNESQKRVGEAVGVEERFLIRAMKGTISTSSAAPRQIRQLAIHRRFYTALALHDLMNEVRLSQVASTYKLNKGSLQSLQQQTATFAGMVTVFCHRLGWNTMHVLLEHFQSRLQFGVQLELCQLMRLPSMDSHSARLLYDAGLTNISSVATASPENVEVLLKNARPFEENLGETIADGRTLVAEARKMLQLELGVRIDWNESKAIPSTVGLVENLEKVNQDESRGSQKILTPVLERSVQPLSPVENLDRSSFQQLRRTPQAVISPLALQAVKNSVKELTPVLAGNVQPDSPADNFLRPSSQQQKRKTTTARTNKSSPLLPKSTAEVSKNSTKENRKPAADVTPDMFQDSMDSSADLSPLRTSLTKAVESLRLSENESLTDTVRTPHFAACAEKLIRMTEGRPPPPLATTKCLKRRTSVELSFGFEATPPGNQLMASTRTLRKKTRMSNSPPPPHSASSGTDTDDSSIIPSTAPIVTELKVNEITTLSKLDCFIREQRRSGVDLAIHPYKEKSTLLGIVAAWSPEKVHYIRLREHYDSQLDQRLVSTIQSWFQRFSVAGNKALLVIHDVRTTTRDLRSFLPPKLVNGLPFLDVDLAHWILEPGNASTSIQKLNKTCSSQSGVPFKAHRGRDKVLHECRALLEIHESLCHRLKDVNLWSNFVEVEMPAVSIMLRMEEMGMAFDRPECESTLQLLRKHLKQLEESAHRLAGRPFSLTSVKETTKVIAKDLCLFEDRPPNSFINPLKKKYQPPSVSKASLVKLGRVHPLPKIVVEYRKISAIIQTILCPLLQASTFHLDGIERISGECEFRNITGRVNIVQPNLQHIPRPFTLSDNRAINIRAAFRSIPGTTLLSADYSQLELRILAHLSGDTSLCSILSRPDGDVFRRIASSCNGNKREEDVTDEERQQAKQICYGLIYGMGCKSLAEQLEVEEEEAQLFVDSFHSTYPEIKNFINKTIEECRSQGYILTMHGRKRFLPAINSTSNAHRAAAERQAVNTKIQGSAADLMKTALTLLDRSLRDKFKDALLIHQIHDELLFQVSTESLQKVARIVRTCMETAVTLKIRLPVSIKTGPSWGHMVPFTL